MLSCLTNSVLHRYPPLPLSLKTFRLLSCCKYVWDIDVPFRPGYSIVSYFRPVDQLLVFVFVNRNLLQKEAFMIRVERCAYLWEKKIRTNGVFITMSI